MFPTCSNSDLAGRKALSATDLTMSPPARRPPGRAPTDEEYWMPWDSATHNRTPGNRLLSQADPARRPGSRWYVPRALGEENATSAHPPHRLRGARSHALVLLAFGAIASSLAACGGGERQDV